MDEFLSDRKAPDQTQAACGQLNVQSKPDVKMRISV